MITIDSKKFCYRGCVAESLNDGSVRITRFIEAKDRATELLTMKKGYGYYSSNTYELSVNLPPTPKLDTVCLVSHTSANSWRIVVGNLSGAEVFNYRTLSEVKGCLDKVFS